MAAFWLISFGGALGLAGLMGRRASLSGLWAGVWVFWSFLGLLLGVLLPGVSYLFLVPALVAGACGLLLAGSAGGRTAAAVLPVFVAGLLWFTVVRSLYLGLGLAGLLVSAVLTALVFSALTPLMAGAEILWRRWLPLAALALAVVCAVLARTSPAFSPAAPQPLDLAAWGDAGTGESRWLLLTAPPFPAAMRQAADFGRQPVAPFPWSPPFERAFVAPAPRLSAPGPEAAVLADSIVDGKRHLRLRLTSPRGAFVVSVFLPAAANPESIRLDGEAVELPKNPGRRAPRSPGWLPVTLLTLAPQGSEMEVVLGATQPTDWYVVDKSYDLPAAAQGLLAARPKSSVPLQEGNRTLVSRKVRI